MKDVIFNLMLAIIISLFAYHAVIYLFNFVNPWLAILLVVGVILVITKLSDKIVKSIFKSKKK
jgi:hypothetical protein